MSQDVSGRELKVGQKVAFCLDGKSYAMRIGEVVRVLRIGEVVRVMPKTVAIKHETYSRWNRLTEEVETVCAFSSVRIVEEA